MRSFALQAPLLCILACSYVVRGEDFLGHDLKATHLSAVRHDEALQQEMASVMGCLTTGKDHPQQNRAHVERALTPMWRVLPKNGHGRVEWRMLRYLTNRYFLQQSSLRIRGLEPVRQVNGSHAGAAEILSKRVPSLVETLLDSKRSSRGFSLEDAVALIATIEQLVLDSESALLERVFRRLGRSMQQSLTRQQLLHTLEGYVLLWMVGGMVADDQEIVELLVTNRAELEANIPNWNSVSGMIDGLISSMEYSRRQSMQAGHGQLVMSQAFSFEDAHHIVGALTKTFASYWRSECQSVKTGLEALDYSGTGRVKLSDFYGANTDGDWHFGESEAYLREVGALDETSAWNGKQVIIANYVQNPSNCIVHSDHYLLCCSNECEEIMKDIERDADSPLVAPETILHTVANITALDDEPPKLTSMLKNQLEHIAKTHGGNVPLHGRLFAQWLHYVFPRECPFPHKAGSIMPSSPKDYGDSYVATDEEIHNYASIRNMTIAEASASEEEEEMLLQWSEEEELIADYSAHLRAPWQKNEFALVGLFGSSLIVLWFKIASGSKPGNQLDGVYQCQPKVHFV